MAEYRLRLSPLLKSLSARLLVLTIFFVMLAEVLIYAPSIARFRLVYLERGQPVRAQEVDVIPRRANRPEGRLSTNAAVFGPERLLFDRLIAIL